MLLAYCSDGLSPLSAGIYQVENVLDPGNPEHQAYIAAYAVVVEADLYDAGDPATANKAGCPNLVVLDNGVARFKQDADNLPDVKKAAMATLSGVIDVISSLGCVTSVVDAGKAIKMDCDRLSISNMEALLTLMQAWGQTSNVIRDYNNGFHNLTVAQIQQIHLDLLTNGMGAYQIKWTAEAQIQEATTIAQVVAILAALPHA